MHALLSRFEQHIVNSGFQVALHCGGARGRPRNGSVSNVDDCKDSEASCALATPMQLPSLLVACLYVQDQVRICSSGNVDIEIWRNVSTTLTVSMHSAPHRII
jgi:hypothetical protein